ncbi:hypothetical protein D5281_13545 [bacterium 1xD42-62]|uniref:Ubiquitin-like domain-containing protein n=2 Tax=Parablautia muri TaxID=2320879 RepID=A0A9X5BGG0_9FIRM|nr:hypothetical protein [Parablautia muri]
MSAGMGTGMILVDIQIPALDRVYDFELDEGLTVRVLMQDIQTLVSKQEKIPEREDGDSYLYSLGQERILRQEETLKQQGVQDGDRLILI